MAITVTPNAALTGENIKVFDIISDADADTTTGNIAHGLGEIPQSVVITPVLAVARLSEWIATTIDATNVVLSKTTATGSGDAAVQVRLVVAREHSMVR